MQVVGAKGQQRGAEQCHKKEGIGDALHLIPLHYQQPQSKLPLSPFHKHHQNLFQ